LRNSCWALSTLYLFPQSLFSTNVLQSATNRVVFGAQQAILVRDENAADRLDSRLQGLCNVLPIMDSKGKAHMHLPTSYIFETLIPFIRPRIRRRLALQFLFSFSRFVVGLATYYRHSDSHRPVQNAEDLAAPTARSLFRVEAFVCRCYASSATMLDMGFRRSDRCVESEFNGDQTCNFVK
jgi:hypothetical protein